MIVRVGKELHAFYQIGETLDDVERDTILVCFFNNSENRTKTARSLKIHLRTLRYKLARYGIAPGPYFKRGETKGCES